MSASAKSTTGNRTVPEAQLFAGMSSVSNVVVRVAGRVPTRVDLRFAGSAEQQLGLSLGTVLIYLSKRGGARRTFWRSIRTGSESVSRSTCG